MALAPPPTPPRRRRRTRWMSLLIAVLTTAGVSLSAVWLTAGNAAAASTGRLVSAASGRCLDVVGNAATTGTRVQIWDCNGQANQTWTFTDAGELRVFNNSLCLDAEAGQTSAGTAAIIWSCTGAANQQWRLSSNGSITGVQSGLCLDVSGAATAAGTLVALWNCNGQANQRWSQGGGNPTTPPPTPGGCNVAPVDPNATASARRLLCYVYSQSGNHILSGQQESTWVSGPEYEMNIIRNASGKYPAVRGQDMGDAPDFGARGLAWWNAGGIPMVGYHMGSPAQNTDGYDGSRMPANINAALTSGTADNGRLNQRLTAWANQLKIIQNGGGAVLFRPWHEASGTWFWWSMEGAGQYNRLWAYTYNFMRAQGVHNLVYLHPFNGSPSSAWYPGKQYVDIGGADTYAGDHGPLTSMFNAARNVYGGSIPIALHENGRIPDPAQLQSSGTRWVLFNTWHTSFISDSSINSPSFINTVYNSSYVVTRDEVPNLR
ncbi:lectin [Micromonospora sp. NBC_00330]|uniref:lectin n=1 Tax=Micromonospora sp. NBC_00330 TaxID=2903585 RepID=UPI002E2C316E|nr:lectin [Micromonospora sp. NBC_00330]